MAKRKDTAEESGATMPQTEPPAAGVPRKASRLLECRIAPATLAKLADAQADTHLDIKRRREELAAYSSGVRQKINEDLRRLDRLADKVNHARFMGYVLCYETPGADGEGNPVLRIRRADTGETWDEPVKPGAQLTAVAELPAPPERPSDKDVKAKRCLCPKPEHAQAGETWWCPAEDHGHMWCNLRGEIEHAPDDPTAALEEGEGDAEPEDEGGAT